MLKIKLLLFYISLYLCQCSAATPEDSSQSYDLVQMVKDIGSHIITAKNMKEAEGDVTSIISILDKLNKFLDLLSPNGTFNPIFEEMQSKFNNSRCLQDICYTLRSAKQREMWAIKIIDALGKPPAGIMEGNLKWFGDYYECTTTQAPTEKNTTFGDFQAQYCVVPVNINVTEIKTVLPLVFGVCVPNSCVTKGRLHRMDTKMEIFIAKLTDLFPELKDIREAVTFQKETCHATSKKLTVPAIDMICFISFFVVLSLVASSITVFEKIEKCIRMKNDLCASSEFHQVNADTQADDDMIDLLTLSEDEYSKSVLMKYCKQFLNCFCLLTNGAKVLNTDSSEEHLPCLHGIRFLSMSWVILCHTYGFGFNAVGNILETLDLIDNRAFQLILNGFFSVDSFFLLSGLLMAYLFFQQAEKTNGKIPWLYFYVHRYLRLTPVYMICVGIFTTLFYYIASGPLWTTNEIDPFCQKNWWWNILYINNFQSAADMCYGWSWYLANDMQFFAISPLFLITLWRWPKVGYSLLGLFLCGCFAANFVLTYHYDTLSGLGNIAAIKVDMNTFVIQWAEYFDKIYTKPYTRISPYLVGIALGYYMFRWKQNNKGKISWIVLISGWVITVTTTLTCLFILYNRNLTTVEASFYNATNHTVFAISLSWVIFTCLNGQGGPVNSILSCKLFIPLSRLTYSAYLIHPIIMYIFFNSSKIPLHFIHLKMVISFLGLLLITYACAFIVSLLFESPIIRLEKFLRTKLSS